MEATPEEGGEGAAAERDEAAWVPAIEWEQLEATWLGLGRLLEEWKPTSQPWATLCEARRLVEVEMRMQRYDDQWRQLTGGG